MTKKEAKELAIAILQYYLDNPKCKNKEDLSKELFDKIKDFKNYCPLCNLFYSKMYDVLWCPKCPLLYRSCNEWSKESIKKRLEILKAWNPREY